MHSGVTPNFTYHSAKMISCLIDYIGLLGVTASDSGLYVNDLPGITTYQLEQITDNTERTATADEWTKIYNRASRLFEKDLLVRFSKYFKNYNILNTSVTGYLRSNDLTSISGKYSGWWFDFLGGSKNAKIQIESIGVFLDSYADFTIRIYDLGTGHLLDMFPTSGNEGFNTVKIQKSYPVWKYGRVFVCYDTDEIQPYELKDFDTSGYALNGSIAKISSVVKDNLDSTPEDIGMTVTYSIVCSIDNIVCQRLEFFADAFLYKLGIEFLKEAKYSDRINRYTLLNTEERTAQILEFREEYDDLLGGALKDMHIPEDACFKCDKGISKRIQLP